MSLERKLSTSCEVSSVGVYLRGILGRRKKHLFRPSHRVASVLYIRISKCVYALESDGSQDPKLKLLWDGT